MRKQDFLIIFLLLEALVMLATAGALAYTETARLTKPPAPNQAWLSAEQAIAWLEEARFTHMYLIVPYEDYLKSEEAYSEGDGIYSKSRVLTKTEYEVEIPHHVKWINRYALIIDRIKRLESK